MSDEQPLRRCAILGTANSWRQCPWHDTSLEIFGLNDAHVLGYARVDRWFDLHHFSHFVFYDRQRPPDPRAVPPGTYFRPKGHLEWLKRLTIPLFLHEAHPAYPTSVTFPRDEVLTYWHRFWPWRISRAFQVSEGPDYEMSSPAWMFMWAVMAGYTEIHIYGIHLSTEWEYLKQRPNLEFLIGVAAGLGVRVVLPDVVKLCKGTFQYGYQPKDDVLLEPTQKAIDYLKTESAHLRKQLQSFAWYQRGPKANVASRLQTLELELSDQHMQLSQLRARVG